MSLGLLAVALDFSGVPVDEFNDWYDLEHLPQRRSVPGILSAQRWLAVEHPAVSFAIYDLETLEVLQSPAYQAMVGEHYSPWSKRIMARTRTIRRIEADQVAPGDMLAAADAAALFAVWMNVDAEHDAEFNRWYDEEHLPGLAAVDGVLSARRFKTREAQPTYLSVYHLASPEVRGSTAWKKVVDTPWTERIRPLMKNREAWSCRAYRRAEIAV